MHRDGVVIVAGDAAKFLGVEVGIPVGVGPGRAEEVERVEEVVGRNRLAVGEAGLRVEFEVRREAVLGERPTKGEARDGFVGIGVLG